MTSLERVEFEKKYNYQGATPMMKQYLDLKFENQQALLLFRLGDFYEMFFDDALTASKILGIALAKRGKVEENNIPMCGVPHHALENYLHKLITEGYKVAICDQFESPEEAKKRGGYKAVVKRDISRIITPGTVIEENILDPIKPSYLCAITIDKNEVAICYADISTGEFKLLPSSLSQLSAELARLDPKEILLSQKLQSHEFLKQILHPYSLKLVYQVDHCYEVRRACRQIETFYNLATYQSLGSFVPIQIAAIGAVLQYISITQKQNLPSLSFPQLQNANLYMHLDPATRSSLELNITQNGERKGSLLWIIDQTVTKSGSRLLYNYLNAPLTNLDLINARQQLTDFFIENFELTLAIREILKQSNDLERAVSKIGMKRGGPFDLLIIRHCLETAYLLKEQIYNKFGLRSYGKCVEQLVEQLNFDYPLLEKLIETIKEDAPNNMVDGGFIKSEYHPKLTELRSLVENSRTYIERLKNEYQRLTGVDSLKINNNNVLGLYVEVTTKQSEKITDPLFVHKQTTVNSVRYTTVELQELESKLVNANSQAIALEYELFDNLCKEIIVKADELRLLSIALSQLDVFTNFAYIAKEFGYIKPEISNNYFFHIKEGRHPVVEESLKLKQENFTPNSCELDLHQRIWLLTGPNMGGKSTFLRQNALIAILAQIGSYVPAANCKIGVIDKIFSRIGAGDDLSKGQSTFMVEMVETAAILAQATPNSLIILDEVGRGTATYDGMAIAWSIIEYIHNQLKCRCLFATHYHELTHLSESLLAVKNYTVAIKEIDENILFLHQIKAGVADKSYGIHVAEIAGLPRGVIKRAKSLLVELEKAQGKETSRSLKSNDANLDLFIHNNNTHEKIAKLEALKNKIISYNSDDLSPRQALEIIYDLQNYAKNVN